MQITKDTQSQNIPHGINHVAFVKCDYCEICNYFYTTIIRRFFFSTCCLLFQVSFVTTIVAFAKSKEIIDNFP